jgi:hypothetical protein
MCVRSDRNSQRFDAFSASRRIHLATPVVCDVRKSAIAMSFEWCGLAYKTSFCTFGDRQRSAQTRWKEEEEKLLYACKIPHKKWPRQIISSCALSRKIILWVSLYIHSLCAPKQMEENKCVCAFRTAAIFKKRVKKTLLFRNAQKWFLKEEKNWNKNNVQGELEDSLPNIIFF